MVVVLEKEMKEFMSYTAALEAQEEAQDDSTAEPTASMAVEVEPQPEQDVAGAVSSTETVPMSDRVGDRMPAPKQVPKRPPLPTDFVWKGMCAICNGEMELPFYPQIGVDATCHVCSKEVREELERVTNEALLEMG